MKLLRTPDAILVEDHGTFHPIIGLGWDELIAATDLQDRLHRALAAPAVAAPTRTLAPVVSQEVWAAGVTYFRSRSARMEESKETGGGSFYDRVYTAERPELFFKATGRRVVGDGAAVRIRGDAHWSVPEPELTLVINPAGAIIGYTIGNDMSSRDIEGENPLYLPQAKVYDGSCAIGPAVLLTTDPLPATTSISISIERNCVVAFSGSTTLAEMKRTPAELAAWLYRENSFPDGALLLTGTGIVPVDEFTLASGDQIRITIDGIGTLTNVVA